MQNVWERKANLLNQSNSIESQRKENMIEIDDTIIDLYVTLTNLSALERTMDGYSDTSEWPFEFYEQLMEASDAHDDAWERAIARLGEEETNRQFSFFSGKRADA